MNVSLTPELERFILEQVESGCYRSASEVVRNGVRMLQEREQERRVRLDALRRAIEVGLDELRQGRGVSAGALAEELLRGLEPADAA